MSFLVEKVSVIMEGNAVGETELFQSHNRVDPQRVACNRTCPQVWAVVNLQFTTHCRSPLSSDLN